MEENTNNTQEEIEQLKERYELSKKISPILDPIPAWTYSDNEGTDADTLALLKVLSTPIPNSFVHKMRGSDYVSHAVVTQRLLALLGPFDQEVLEVFYNNENRIEGAVVRFTFNINGRRVQITEAGSSDAELETKKGVPVHNMGNLIKLCISDALKRAAMRIGVGLNLWSQFQGKPEYVLPGWLGISPWPVRKIKSFLTNTATVLSEVTEKDETVELPSWLVDEKGTPTEVGAIFTKVVFGKLPKDLSTAEVKALHRYTDSRVPPILKIEVDAVAESIADYPLYSGVRILKNE